MGVLGLHQAAAAAYLGAALLAAAGLGLRSRRGLRGAGALLVLGAALHGVAFWRLHSLDPPPTLTQLSFALSLMAWLGTVFYLLLQLRVRSGGLAVMVAPAAFLGAVLGALAAPSGPSQLARASPLWSHLHVLLASGGLALLGLAGGAGVLYLVHHAALKSKRRGAPSSVLPSLENLDQLGAVALAAGFLLLTLGLLTGMIWLHAAEGRLWSADAHANAALLVWVAYAGVAVARFGVHLGARPLALASALGFLVLLLAGIGAEVWV